MEPVFSICSVNQPKNSVTMPAVYWDAIGLRCSVKTEELLHLPFKLDCAMVPKSKVTTWLPVLPDQSERPSLGFPSYHAMSWFLVHRRCLSALQYIFIYRRSFHLTYICPLYTLKNLPASQTSKLVKIENGLPFNSRYFHVCYVPAILSLQSHITPAASQTRLG